MKFQSALVPKEPFVALGTVEEQVEVAAQATLGRNAVENLKNLGKLHDFTLFLCVPAQVTAMKGIWCATC